MTRTRTLRAALAVLLALSALSCGVGQHSIVLVTVAGLRADSVTPDRMPGLARLQQESPLAREAWANSPETLVSLASLMTGTPPDRLGVGVDGLGRIPAEARTLAEHLRAEGYSTAGFVGDSRTSSRTGLARGFDVWISPEAASAYAVTPAETGRIRAAGGGTIPAASLADLVGNHLRQMQLERRSFIWVHLADLSAASTAQEPQAAYSSSLRPVDDAISYIHDALATFGLRDTTDLVVASLHGLALGDEGEVGSGLTLAESVVRVPIAIEAAGETSIELPPGPIDLASLGQSLRGDATPSGPILTVTWVPQRVYGWPAVAGAGGREGWLWLDPQPRWQPSGTDSPATGGLDAAPEEYRERLEEAGFLPERLVQATEPAVRAAVLDLMQRAHREMLDGRGRAAAGLMREAVALAPEAIAPRLTLMKLLAASPGSPATAEDLLAAAGLDADPPPASEASPTREADIAGALIDAGQQQLALRRLLSLEEDSLPRGQRLRAAEHLERLGAFEEARRHVESVAETEPEAPELHEWLGDLDLRSGNGFRARLAYEKALGFPRQRSANLLVKLGDALANVGEDDAALQRYAEALQVDPGYLYPHARAAEIYLRRGEAGPAIEAVKRSVPVTGDAPADALARASALAGAGLTAAAREQLETAHRREPDEPRLRVALARMSADAGALERARSLLEPLAGAVPAEPRALYELARVEVLSDRAAEAEALLRRIDPRSDAVAARLIATEPLFRGQGEGSPLAALARSIGASVGTGRPPDANR